MRAFIFSLDSFVAFTLALVAIYSLIFFSSVPSAYYYLLTQGHYLSRDILLSAATTDCVGFSGCTSGSIMDNIISHSGETQKNLVKETVGVMVPPQFGYILEVGGDTVYSTKLGNDGHATQKKKLTIATQILNFGYSGQLNKLTKSPYQYNTCHGDAHLGSSNGDIVDFGLITCGVKGFADGTTKSYGNLPPSDSLGGGDVVPSTNVKVVKLTIFI